MTKLLAWHFLRADKRLQYSDCRQVQLGEALTVDETRLNLCNYGLHASVKALDALSFVGWGGAIACRVELGGRVIKGTDKCVASERTVIAWCPADAILHEFACRVAEDVLHVYEAVYPGDLRPRQAIEAKREWLRGEITDEELDAARDAAYAAYAAADAAYAAEYAAADAADAAAWAAVRAAWAAGAARDAADAADAAAAWAAYAVKYAADAAAWAAVRAEYAAYAVWGMRRNKYNSWLEEMLTAEMGREE